MDIVGKKKNYISVVSLMWTHPRKKGEVRGGSEGKSKLWEKNRRRKVKNGFPLPPLTDFPWISEDGVDQELAVSNFWSASL